MYKIYADGALIWDAAQSDGERVVLNPSLSLDVDKAGSLSFVMLPDHPLYGEIKRLKTIVRVEDDGEELFRGRVLTDERDLYRQMSVTCEGDTAFLLDSLQRPFSFSGTAEALFNQLITRHNAQVDADRKFTVGNVTVPWKIMPLEIEETGYNDTMSIINNRLLSAYGGYLKTRTENGARVLDWLEAYGNEKAQNLEFSVNLLDIKDKTDTGDVFTVLIPLGASGLQDDGTQSKPLTIADANGGKDYLEDTAGIALYGRIWKALTWDYIESAWELMEKGQEALATGAAVPTITLKAVDMHLLNGDVDSIRVGDSARIVSDPHGIDKVMSCPQIKIDMLNPDNTQYTFGRKQRMLTDNVRRTEKAAEDFTGTDSSGRRGGGGGGKSVQDQIGDIERWAEINVDKQKAQIELTTGQINNLTGEVSKAFIQIDGVNATIQLKVSKDDIISSINMSPEAITIQSKRIDLQGYVTASALSAELGNMQRAYADTISTTNLNTNNFRFQSNNIVKASDTVITGVSLNVGRANIETGNGMTVSVVTSVSLSKSSDQILYLAY